MLDAATLALLAKLKILGKRTGVNVDLIRIGGEAAYAELTLRELSNAGDPELARIAVQLMNHFGIDTSADQSTTDDSKGDGRYVGALR